MWNPVSWWWVDSIGLPADPGEFGRGKLVDARPFANRGEVSAIELTVVFNGVLFQTILRLDDSAGILGLSKQLNELRGFTLKQIGAMEF